VTFLALRHFFAPEKLSHWNDKQKRAEIAPCPLCFDRHAQHKNATAIA